MYATIKKVGNIVGLCAASVVYYKHRKLCLPPGGIDQI